MKFACTILIAVLALHSQCGATCVADALRDPSPAAATTSSEPPCHQHPQTPTNSPDKPQDTSSSPCSQGPIVEAKASSITKVVLNFAASVPAVLAIALNPISRIAPPVNHSTAIWSSPPASQVLRI